MLARRYPTGPRVGRALFVALILACCGFAPTLAVAQLIQTADDDDLSPQKRDQLYASLAKDVAALEQQYSVLKTVIKLVRPTVVHIEAKKVDQATYRVGRSRDIEEAGSGVVIEFQNKFYVLTNRHVIKQADNAHITIRLADGRELHPAKTWEDKETDVAVMAIDAPDLVPARLGDSDRIDIGDFVLAVGSPFGQSHSFTHGIISAKGRRDLQLGDDGVKFQDFLQTDAPINPGNSGGPLLNLRGEVIAINTAIASNSGGNEGIGFAIPINMGMSVAKQLIEHGKVVRAFMGVELDFGFTASAAAKLGMNRPVGARLTAVTANSPADAARLQAGDVIVDFGGVRIRDYNHLMNLVALTEVGREVPVTVLRDNKPLNVTIKVGVKPKN